MSQFRSLITFFAVAIAAAACSTTPTSPPQTTATTVTVTPPSSTEAAPPSDSAGPLAEPAGQPLADPVSPPVADPGKPPPVAHAPQDHSTAPGFVACAKRLNNCTKELKPVCGVVDTGIRCIRAPCPSTAEQTFGNACEACADSKTAGYRAGSCPAPTPQGDQSADR